MKKLLYYLILTATSALAQSPVPADRRFDLAATYGFFSTPEFRNATGGEQFGADFDYHLPNSRLTLSAGFLTGTFDYFEDQRSNAPNAITITRNGKLTNGENNQLHTGFQVKYRIVQTDHFVWQAGWAWVCSTNDSSIPSRTTGVRITQRVRSQM